MSTNITLTIDGPMLPHPSTTWLHEQSEAHLDLALPGEDWGPEGSVTLTEDPVQHVRRTVIQWWDRKYGLDGVEAYARLISKVWPVEVELLLEWDSHDADEPGAEGTRYRDGRVIAHGQQQMVWAAMVVPA